MLLFPLKFKFNLFSLLFVKIIISLKAVFNLNRKSKGNIGVFLKGENIKIKFIFL